MKSGGSDINDSKPLKYKLIFLQNELQIKLWVTLGLQRKWTLFDVIFSLNLSFVYQILQERCLAEPSVSSCMSGLLLEG